MKFIKFVLILISIAAALCALLFFKGMTSSERLLHKMVFIESSQDWNNSELSGCSINANENSIRFASSKDDDQSLVTDIVDAGFDFDQLILSWNIDINGDLRPVVFEVEVSPDNKDWYLFDYLTWGSEETVPGKSVKRIENIGKVNVDVLKFYKTMRYVKVHMTVPKGDYFGSLNLRRLSLALSSESPNWKEYLENLSPEDLLD